jgi:Cys/Met metabolism PLP-dependent enzyme
MLAEEPSRAPPAPAAVCDTQTLAARGGAQVAPGVAPPLVLPIYQSTVYAYPSLETLEAAYRGEERGYVYYRHGYPNGTALADAVATLKGVETAGDRRRGHGGHSRRIPGRGRQQRPHRRRLQRLRRHARNLDRGSAAAGRRGDIGGCGRSRGDRGVSLVRPTISMERCVRAPVGAGG